MKNKHLAFLTITLLLGCFAARGEPNPVTANSNVKAITSKASVEFMTTTTNLATPESVVFDAKRNTLFVSQQAGAVPGDGSIAKVSLDGKMLNPAFTTGLNDPKGIVLANGKLYVSDLMELLEIDPDSGAVLHRYTGPNVKFLNDTTVDDAGNVYVSDMFASAIYRLDRDQKFDVWFESPEIENPNGLLAVGGEIYIAGWGNFTDSQPLMAPPGHFLKINLTSKQVTRITSEALGNLDGLQINDADSFILSDWKTGKIYKITKSGEVELLLETQQGSGDILFLPEQGLLVLPMKKQNELRFYTISGKPSKALIKLENPITTTYLKEHLTKNLPRLILTPEIEVALKAKLKSDPVVQTYYAYLKTEAAEILKQPLAQHIYVGFRMPTCGVMAKRLGILAMVNRLEPDPKLLNRLNDELLAVSHFPDWNPEHFLDVSQMSLGVALALDWAGDALPPETLKLAKAALIEKAILPCYNTSGVRMGWINGHNNWNSVCHGGMVVASLAIADIDPELAAKTISRALDKLPGSLEEYYPDGAYPEGPSYWRFGTSFAVMAANTLKTALGSDFGISASPGFMQGADFRLQATAPSGECFNFSDSDSKPDGESSVLLAWFAAQTGDGIYLDRTFFAKPAKGERLAGAGLVWLSQFTELKKSDLPLTWCGKGTSPVAVFRAPQNDPGQLYLAAKGGFTQISHGNMDAGTFVFELNGVRWVVDPGNQEYNLLNKINFPLGDYTQKSERWTLLTKSNKTHSTVVVNNARFNVTGQAPLADFKMGDSPEATFDLSATLNGEVKSWQRRFVKESNQSVLIHDRFETNDRTKEIVWQLITTAEVEPVDSGAILRQGGKELSVSIVTPQGLMVNVVSLDPPPLEIDKTIKGLKRVEIRVPASAAKDGQGEIKVRLAGRN